MGQAGRKERCLVNRLVGTANGLKLALTAAFASAPSASSFVATDAFFV